MSSKMTSGCSRIGRSFECRRAVAKWSAARRGQQQQQALSGARRLFSVEAGHARSDGVRVVVGIEVHARVQSHTKLFSNGSADYERGVGKPNAQVSLFDAAIPGTLPVVDEECVNQAIRCGLALEGTINRRSVFERKHYFYSDMPLGYQVTQQRSPIVTGGTVSFLDPVGGGGGEGEGGGEAEKKHVRVARVQLEQDSGKSIHSASGEATYVDLNRAGMALLEIVSEPDMRSAAEATAYLSAVRAIVRAIGVSDGNMEDGSFRADVNVSVEVDDPSGGQVPLRSPRVELKNMNSLRNATRAIEYETARLSDSLLKGEAAAADDGDASSSGSETRTFDVATGTTKLLRAKEDRLDYRFLVDPDLPPLVVGQSRIDHLAATLPELPEQTLKRLLQEPWALTREQAALVVNEYGAEAFIQSAVETAIASLASGGADGGGKMKDNKATLHTLVRKLAVNWTMVELVGHLHAQGQDLVNGPVSAEQLGQLVALLASEQVYGKAGKAVVKLLVEAGGEWAGADPRDVVKAHDWGTAQASELDVCEVVRQVVFSDEFGEELRVYRNGKKNLAMFFVGQVMKLTKGKAPPKQVNLLVRQVLDEDEAAQQQKNDNK